VCDVFVAGLKRSLRSGAVGFGLAAAYCLYAKKDNLKQIFGMKD